MFKSEILIQFKQSCSLVSYDLLFQNTPICDLKETKFFNLNI